jgi:hypothetical protein
MVRNNSIVHILFVICNFLLFGANICNCAAEFAGRGEGGRGHQQIQVKFKKNIFTGLMGLGHDFILG